jgi:hypothetical protein
MAIGIWNFSTAVLARQLTVKRVTKLPLSTGKAVLGDRFESLARRLVGGIEHGHEEFGGSHVIWGREHFASFTHYKESTVMAEIVWFWLVEWLECIC